MCVCVYCALCIRFHTLLFLSRSRFQWHCCCCTVPHFWGKNSQTPQNSFMRKLWAAYSAALVSRPIFTNTVTASVVAVLGDLAAQRIETSTWWGPIDATRRCLPALPPSSACVRVIDVMLCVSVCADDRRLPVHARSVPCVLDFAAPSCLCV